MKKLLWSVLAFGMTVAFAACGETATKPKEISIALEPSAYEDVVGKLGTRYDIPEAFAKDELGNGYACEYTILSPSGQTVATNGGMFTLSEIGTYTITYVLANEKTVCEPLVFEYLCTASGELYVIEVERTDSFSAELGEPTSVPDAWVSLYGEKAGECVFKVLDPENEETDLVNGTFTPETVGEYTVVYESVNAKQDAEAKSVKIAVSDSKSPEIKVGELVGNLKYNQTVSLPEWSVYDASQTTVVSVLKDGNGQEVAVGEDGRFVVRTRGEYIWKVTAVDGYGNRSEFETTYRVDAYDENVADGLLSDFDEGFYATESAFVSEGKASVYTGVQAIPTVKDGALNLQKGEGTSKIGLQFARWTTVSENTYLYFKIKSNAEKIHVGRLDETKYFEMSDLSAFGYSYAESDWQTVWVKPSEIGLSESDFYGVQLVFDGKTDCAVLLDEIGYRHDFVKYTIGENLSDLDLYAEENYPVEFTVSSKNGEVASPNLTVRSLDESAGVIQDGVFLPKKKGNVTFKIAYLDDGMEMAVKYLTLEVRGTIRETLAEKLGENEVVMWNDPLYEHVLSELLIDKYNNPCVAQPDYPDGWYLITKWTLALRLNPSSQGSGFRIRFPKAIESTKGCLKIGLIFDNASQANTTLKLFSYDETNVENSLDFTGFTDNRPYLYVPLSMLANDKGVVEGLQFAFTTGGWKYFSTITYDPDYVDYKITENMTSLTFVEGNEYDLTESISLDGKTIANADLRYAVEDEEILSIANGKLTAKKRGVTTVTIGYYENDELVFSKAYEIEVYKPIVEQLADMLTGDQVYMWNTTLYEHTMSALTVDKYNASPVGWMLYNTNVGEYACVRISCAETGSGFKLTFPKAREYAKGCLRIRLIFDSDNHAASSTLKIFRYEETSAENGWTFTGFKAGNQNFVYIPVSLLTNEDGNIDGLQFAFTTGGWKMFSDIVYLPDHSAYEITENLTSLTLAAEEEYTVSASATDNLEPIINPDIRFAVTDESVLKIENGKLFALKSGTTTVKITLYGADGASELTSKTVTLTVGKTALEQLGDSLGENQIHMWNTVLYEKTMSAVIVDKYNEPCAATPDQPNGWYFTETNAGANYSSIRVNPATSGSGFRLKFVKTQTFAASGYLKIRIVAKANQVLHLYNYNETDSTKGLVITGAEEGWNNGWASLYVPIESFLNANGQLEGIQFAFEVATGWQYFGAITYVAELPTA